MNYRIKNTSLIVLKVVAIIAALIVVLLWHLNTLAADTNFTFDANYYARKYPDIVTVLGNDPTVLQNHYNTSGIAEGRYCSQAEESYYASINQLKPKTTVTVPSIITPKQEEDKIVTKPIEPTMIESTTEIIPVYNTYVDVDITNQTVTYFENGIAKLQSPCVTGNASLHRDTPTGVYTIKTHQTNKYLVGPTWRSFVSYWMRFTDTAVGLHDATWRSSFGGDIYKTNGSHGCVNLPKDFTAELFDAVDVGTVVYVH